MTNADNADNADNGSSARGPEASPLSAPAGYAFPKDEAELLAWSHAVRQLEQARSYWLATTSPDGAPHVTPLWGVWLDGALYVDGHPRTRWARNIAANPAVCVHLESGADVVILDGIVEDITTDEALGQRIIAAWMAKYGKLHPDPSGSGMFRMRPRVGRGWSTESLKDGARWRFDSYRPAPPPEGRGGSEAASRVLLAALVLPLPA